MIIFLCCFKLAKWLLSFLTCSKPTGWLLIFQLFKVSKQPAKKQPSMRCLLWVKIITIQNQILTLTLALIQCQTLTLTLTLIQCLTSLFSLFCICILLNKLVDNSFFSILITESIVTGYRLCKRNVRFLLVFHHLKSLF